MINVGAVFDVTNRAPFSLGAACTLKGGGLVLGPARVIARPIDALERHTNDLGSASARAEAEKKSISGVIRDSVIAGLQMGGMTAGDWILSVADNKTRSEIMQICDIFRAKIVDVAHKALTIEITGNESKVTKFLELMEPFGVRDITRTGKVAMPRK